LATAAAAWEHAGGVAGVASVGELLEMAVVAQPAERILFLVTCSRRGRVGSYLRR
jgi:hypothetical protein